MKFGKTAKIGALVLTLGSPALLGIFSPSLAGTPSSSSLIDKDFEVAVRKFVSKRFFNRIDASDEQREKLSKIMADTQDQTRAIREQLRKGILDLSNLMAEEKTTDEQIKAKVKELRSMHEQVQDMRLSSVLEARKILTAEQRHQIHNRVSELITGGLKPKKIGMLLRADRDGLFGED